MQSFLGKINFVKRFISNFAETVKPLQELVNKYIPFKWDKQQGCSFTKIKGAIVDAPFLQILNFNKDFSLCTFASDTTFIVVLMQ